MEGLDESNARFEAQLCMPCGSCFECDNCYDVSPDNAIIKPEPGTGFAIAPDYCMGAGCVRAECPAGRTWCRRSDGPVSRAR
ncbi:hypothetical protein AB0C70_40030 [Streptomyces sp. NPDC048564]|uniref:hypothetical protein n=1 Tax=unclassified Streptomyces TaxID=2593676 RepID=UPI0033CF0C1C